MSSKTAPKIFISHSTADKDRFVLGFARRLRERGIDAWLDLWEMNPGDSLVDKVFAYLFTASNPNKDGPLKEGLDKSLVFV